MKKLLLFFMSIFLLSSCQPTRLRMYALGPTYEIKSKVPGYISKVKFEYRLNLDKRNNQFIFYYGLSDCCKKLSYDYEDINLSYKTSHKLGYVEYETDDFILYDSNGNLIKADEDGMFAFKLNTNLYISYSHLPENVIEEIESNDDRNSFYINGWFFILAV